MAQSLRGKLTRRKQLPSRPGTTRTATSTKLSRAGRGGTGSVRRTVASSHRPQPHIRKRAPVKPPRLAFSIDEKLLFGSGARSRKRIGPNFLG